MRTLIPHPVTATARPLTRTSRLLGYGLTPRALLLFAAGLIAIVPAFFHPHRLALLLVWDALLLALTAFDAARLPSPATITITRTFLDSPRLGEPTRIEFEVLQSSNALLGLTLTDALDPTLQPIPVPLQVTAYPRDPIRTLLTCFPARRGDLRLGNIFLRYRSGLKLVERWAVADAAQNMRVFPAMQQNGDSSSLYLMRARQIELQKRRLRQRGIGREFESLRDYVHGDEPRNLSWAATARRGKLITRQYTTERSQQVWVVLDAGRLSRTAFSLQRLTHPGLGESEFQTAEAIQLVVTQLDQATTAAVMLAEAVGSSGDKCGLLTYGRALQQQLLPGAGPAHLRAFIDQLSQVRAEPAEANHLQAASRLKHLQRRRGLIVWITEIADSAGRPEIVSAAVELVRRHLVLLVLLHHPELETLAARPASSVEEMFASAAAAELRDRRRETIASLHRQGVLVVESTPGEVGMRTINSYLDVKARGLL